MALRGKKRVIGWVACTNAEGAGFLGGIRVRTAVLHHVLLGAAQCADNGAFTACGRVAKATTTVASDGAWRRSGRMFIPLNIDIVICATEGIPKIRRNREVENPGSLFPRSGNPVELDVGFSVGSKFP